MLEKVFIALVQHEIDSVPAETEFTVSDLFLPSFWNTLSLTDKTKFGEEFKELVNTGKIKNCINTEKKTLRPYEQELYKRK